MSEIKVNKISPRTACGTVQLGDSGDTITVPAGATITNNGTQTGFGRTGTVDWVTTVQTSTITAANGSGYFVNTTGGAITMNLPAGSAGSIVAFKDYASTFDTNALTVSPNGSEKIGGVAADAMFTTEAQSVTLVYIDSTKGWMDVHDSTTAATGNDKIVATGGTITTSGNDKIHTFTGPGTFTVSQVSPCAANNLVSFMVVAGGASGGGSYGGGGGAGGFRELVSPTAPYTASPLNGYPTPGNRITVTATGYPITVGGGGAAVPGSPPHVRGNNGVNSTFSSITSAGGGAGGAGPGEGGSDGGSGGGAGRDETTNFGNGNTPPVSPAQGTNGGEPAGSSWNGGGGGGGATAVGGNGGGGSPGSETAGNGGVGATTCISATPTGYAGGGGGSNSRNNPPTGTATQGGGAGYNPARSAGAGTVNTGGGGGGSHGCTASGAGGSGIVIIRYKFQ